MIWRGAKAPLFHGGTNGILGDSAERLLTQSLKPLFEKNASIAALEALRHQNASSSAGAEALFFCAV